MVALCGALVAEFLPIPSAFQLFTRGSIAKRSRELDLLERAEAFANAFDIPSAYGRHDAIFQADLDAIVIASASDTHAPLIEQAAHYQVDAFCEKPLGVSPEKIDAALAAVDKSGIRLATGFNRRFDPAFQRVHQQVADGTVGAPEAIVIISRDPGVPTPQELATPNRLLIGTTIDDLDMARFLMRDEIVSISTQDSWLIPDTIKTDQIDGAVVALRFQRGGLGTIVNSYRSNEGYDQRVELYGSKGMGRVNNVAGTIPDVPTGAAFFVKRYAASYVAELKCYFGTLREGKWDPTLATGMDGRIASRLSEAAVKSWKQHAVIQP